MDLSGFTKATSAQWREPDERYLHELFWPDDRGASERQRWELRMEGHRRLTVPLFAIGFAMIALAGVLTGEFNRRVVAWRIAVACACGFAFATGGLGLVQAAIKVPWLLPLVYINLLVAILGGQMQEPQEVGANRRLDADHMGAVLGEVARCDGTRGACPQLEHLEAREDR